MKKTIVITTLSAVIIIIVGSFIAVNAKYNDVKANVKEFNPEINTIESIDGVGGWMEPTSEYTLKVDIDGQRYRIWTYGDGSITDKVRLD